MALDFQNYLFSSTPPDYEQISPLYLSFRRRSPPKMDVSKITACEDDDDGFVDASFENMHLEDTAGGFGLTKCSDRCSDTDRIRRWETAYNCDSESDLCTCTSERRSDKRRSVTFADTAGVALSTVRVIYETSDDPPDFQSQSISNHSATVPSPLHLIVKFSQPVADYFAFQKKLATQCVSLENVVVRDNLRLVGTIKVKNIACSKTVTIRCTFDSWSSCQDIAAKPVSSELCTFGLYVTFTFEITVPSAVSRKHGAIQFAICYNADGQEFWDNNNYQNYVVDVESRVNELESEVPDACMRSGSTGKRESVFAFEQSTSWSEFAGWSDLDCDAPYW